MDDQPDSVPEPIDANLDGVPEPIDDQSDGANDEPEHLQVELRILIDLNPFITGLRPYITKLHQKNIFCAIHFYYKIK